MDREHKTSLCFAHRGEHCICRLKTLWVSLCFAHWGEHRVCRLKALWVSLHFAHQEEHYDFLTYPCVFAYGRGHLEGSASARKNHAFRRNDLCVPGEWSMRVDLCDWGPGMRSGWVERFIIWFDEIWIWYELLHGCILSNWNLVKIVCRIYLGCLYM